MCHSQRNELSALGTGTFLDMLFSAPRQIHDASKNGVETATTVLDIYAYIYGVLYQFE